MEDFGLNQLTKTLKKFEDTLIEDTPTTAMGSGNIATRGIPLMKKPPKGVVMKKFGGIDVFALDPSHFQKSRFGFFFLTRGPRGVFSCVKSQKCRYEAGPAPYRYCRIC